VYRVTLAAARESDALVEGGGDCVTAISDLGQRRRSSGYVYDLETENHHFHAGVGQMIVHNTDGFHIRGLIMNVFQTLWPTLLARNDFVVTLLTPIVKAVHARSGEVVSFFNLSDYEAFFSGDNPDPHPRADYAVKYYKGLGTSSPDEAKEYFRDMRLVAYRHSGAASSASLALAFDKTRADARKAWLAGYDRGRTLVFEPSGTTVVPYEDFVDRELIHFSHYDNERSLPSVVDGLKTSQRKILHGCLKRNLFCGELRVAQLASYVSEHTAYHHGEASLQGAITAMAQDFVGANNVNLLRPIGQFGSRLQGGKDAASPRYIHTRLEAIVAKLFRREDAAVLEYADDDGVPIEPRHYAPVVPLLLINGSVGIGSGYSTSVPPHNPADVIRATRDAVLGREVAPLVPWFRGFEGSVEGDTTRGVFHRESEDVAVVTELPIGTYTDDYKAFLEGYLAQKPGVLRGYENHRCTHVVVHFRLKFEKGALAAFSDERFEKEFRLATHAAARGNMHMFGADGRIKRYGCAREVLADFVAERARVYARRKAHEAARLEAELALLRGKRRFVEEATAGSLALMGRPRADVEADLAARGYPQGAEGDEDYRYLLSMQAASFTLERAAELARQVEAMEQQLARYRATTAEQLWLSELDELEAEYARFQAAHDEWLRNQRANPGKASGAGPAATKRRRAAAADKAPAKATKSKKKA
jgi:DNA topoisomerase-2